MRTLEGKSKRWEGVDEFRSARGVLGRCPDFAAERPIEERRSKNFMQDLLNRRSYEKLADGAPLQPREKRDIEAAVKEQKSHRSMLSQQIAHLKSA